jgi:hypothetical protein
MKVWRWFVGQVTRLRRSIVGVFAPAAERGGRADEHFASADEPAAGPPEHWVARVRRGAPGLLEPSLRRRGEPAGPPVADRVVRSQTELGPQPDSFEEPEREYVPPEPPVGPRRAEAPARAALLRKVLRRRRSPSAVPPMAADASRAPLADRVPHERHAATRQVHESADSPAEEPPSPRRPLDESGPTPTRASPPVADQPERSPRPTEVVELEAPAQRLAARVERAGSPDPPIRAGVAPKSVDNASPPVAGQPERSPRPTEVVEFEAPAQRPAARVERAGSPDRPIRTDVARQSGENALRAELAVDEIGTDRVWERAVRPPAPRRESNVERLPEQARPTSRQESSLEPGPPRRSRAEPLSAVDRHPWPELPPSLDQVDTDVEAALRAWDHQQRLDDEQTRL